MIRRRAQVRQLRQVDEMTDSTSQKLSQALARLLPDRERPDIAGQQLTGFNPVGTAFRGCSLRVFHDLIV